MKSPIDFNLNQLSPLVGGKITALARTGQPEYRGKDEFYRLVVTLADGSNRILMLLSDDEGDAPGSFELHAGE